MSGLTTSQDSLKRLRRLIPPPEARSQHFHQQSTVNMVSDMGNNYIDTVIILYSNDFHGSYCLYYQNQIATQVAFEYRIITVPIL